MNERNKLPAKLADLGFASTTEKRGSLVARGLATILTNNLSKRNDTLYRQARKIYSQHTDDGVGSWTGYEEREIPLTEALNTFNQLAAEGYGKAYFPLYTLFRGGQSIKADSSLSLHFLNLATDWLLDNQQINDPEIWHDLGVIYFGEDNEQAIYWLLKSAETGYSAAMWHLCAAFEDGEDWDNALRWQIKAAKAGHKKAQQGLEQWHKNGDLETMLEDGMVIDWYVWSAAQGHLWAQLFLADAYHCGDLIEQDDEPAAYYFLQAANQNEPHAQLQIGKMYREGCGVARDDEQAKHWLDKSATQGNPEAQYQLGLLLWEMGEEENALLMIESAANQEYGPAQYHIAADEGITFDTTEDERAEFFDKAFTWYDVEVKSGIDLRLDFALIHLDSYQAPYNELHRANRLDGLRLLEEVASKPIVIDSANGEPSSKNDVQRRASRRLGNELLKFANKDNVAEAIRWLEQAADLGDSVACVTLAELYLHGIDWLRRYDSREPPAKLVEIDLQAAVFWYERGNQLGWSTAAYKLGCEYLYGKHLPRNPELAEKWLLQAANAGNISAPSVLGEEYATGVRLRQDSNAAIYWLSLAAEHSQRSCLQLAEIFLDNEITPRNFDEVIKWLNVASADSGTFRNDAMKIAVKKCFDGRFNATEESAAQAWLVQMAAKAFENVADAKYPARDAHNAYHLGELYELGLGVEQNMGKAIHWYRQSADQDLFIAKKRLDELGINWKNT